MSAEIRPAGRGTAALLVLLGGAAFATSGPLASAAAPAHPAFIVWSRVAVAGLALLGWVALRRRPLVRGLTARQRGGLVLAGALLAVHFLLFVWGLRRTSLTAAVSLVALEPLAVVLAAWVMDGRKARPVRLEWVALAAAMTGAFVLARGAGTRGDREHHLEGDLLVVLSTALYGVYVGCARHFRGDLDGERYAGLVYAVAALALTPALPWTLPTELAASSWWALAGLALVPTLIGHTLVQISAVRVSPTVLALVSPGETLGSLAIAVVWWHARPAPLEWLGAGIIVAAATLGIFARR